LYRTKGADSSSFRDHLEDKLTKRHQELWQERPGRRWIGLLRPVPISLVLLVVLFCAAWIPVDVRVKLGCLIDIQTPAGYSIPGPGELTAILQEQVDAEIVSVSISEGDEESHVSLLLFGETVNGEKAVEVLTRNFPDLQDASSEIRTITGNIRSFLVQKVAHSWFAIEIRSSDLDTARWQVMEALSSQGYTDSAVEIRKQGDRREITIDLDQKD
jgi:hypothetical protein